MNPLLSVDQALDKHPRGQSDRSGGADPYRWRNRLTVCSLREIISPIDLPPFDNSAMDGYAIRHEDSAAASAVQTRDCLGSNDGYSWPAVAPTGGQLEMGQAARIMTGAPIPQGASAVIPVEDTDDDWSKAKPARFRRGPPLPRARARRKHPPLR